MKAETIEQYLARGGTITVAKPAPEKYDHQAKYRKDKELNALKQLKKQVKDRHTHEKIDQAIFTRIEILKVTP